MTMQNPKAHAVLTGPHQPIVRSLFIALPEIHLLKKSCQLTVLLFVSALTHAMAATLPCPDLQTAVQVGACPTEEQLKYTFAGYCSDDAKAYKGETDVCTDFERYRQLKNVALWESANGVFDAYVSCDLPKATLQSAKVSGIKVGKQGKVTQLICSYPEGVNFIHRTRAECKVDAAANCAANPETCKASCD
ncbi:MAG: hypothetical protein Q7K57_19635 [Burkholderiaceae bacterium]|nr:hypothetical protein [Burkholderiaceae bacterium]